MLELCRTCHGEITTDDYIAINANNLKSESIKSELLSCVPELQQDLVKDPVLCSTCENALHLAYTFKSQCLNTEENIRNHFLNTNLNEKSVTLVELYKQATKVCLELEDSIVKSPNIVNDGYAVEDDKDTKDFVIEEHDLPVFKEEIVDIDDETPIDLDNSWGNSDNLRTRKGEKPYLCNLCEYRTAIKQHLTFHMRTHTGEKPYQCSTCKYRTAVKHSLTVHMRTHTGEKPYGCTVCEFRSRIQSNLTRHIRTHTGEKPFSCTICDFRASQRTSLAVHLRTHTGEKPYECTVCKFRSRTKSHLTTHMRTHTAGKPFPCTICGFRARRPYNLVVHMRTHQ